MNGLSGEPDRLRKATVLLLTIAVSAAFIGTIYSLLVCLFLAAVFSGLAQPLYRKLLRAFRNRATIAALTTLAILTLVVLLPLLGLLVIIAAQALQLSADVIPWIQERIRHPERISAQLPEWFPFRDHLPAASPQIVSKLGELVGKIGGFLFQSLSAAAQGTAKFFLDLFIMLYAMFFFLKNGPAIRDKALHYLPLPREAKQQLIEKGASVARATVKGTLVIGIVQGALGGLAFAVVGIEGAAFWGAVMAVSSVIPGVGTSLVWVPAVAYLLISGHVWSGLALAVWCAAVVGTVDNLLRPRLVGGDTQMPDLLILVSTFGGLSLFGAVGLIIGPAIAALFVTMWEIYGATFHDVLDKTEAASAES